jgi:hypothetical protein
MTSELKKASVGPVYIGAIIIFLLFSLLVRIWFGLAPKQENFEDKRADNRLAKLNLLEKDNHEKLTGYAWVNQAKGVVQLPIERAEELVVTELKAKPVKVSSVKVEVPYPVGLMQPAASGTAAPAASGTSAAPATSGTSAAPAASPAAAASPAPAATAPAATAAPAPPAAPAASPAAPAAPSSPASSPA